MSDFRYHFDADEQKHTYTSSAGIFAFTEQQIEDMSAEEYEYLISHGRPMPKVLLNHMGVEMSTSTLPTPITPEAAAVADSNEGIPHNPTHAYCPSCHTMLTGATRETYQPPSNPLGYVWYKENYGRWVPIHEQYGDNCVIHPSQKETVQPTTTTLPKPRPPLDPGPNAPSQHVDLNAETLRAWDKGDEVAAKRHVANIAKSLGMTYGKDAHVLVSHPMTADAVKEHPPGFTDADARKLVAEIAAGRVHNAQMACERWMRGPVV